MKHYLSGSVSASPSSRPAGRWGKVGLLWAPSLFPQPEGHSQGLPSLAFPGARQAQVSPGKRTPEQEAACTLITPAADAAVHPAQGGLSPAGHLPRSWPFLGAPWPMLPPSSSWKLQARVSASDKATGVTLKRAPPFPTAQPHLLPLGGAPAQSPGPPVVSPLPLEGKDHVYPSSSTPTSPSPGRIPPPPTPLPSETTEEASR